MTIWDVASRFVLPPILGGLSGLLSSWFAWDIEKRRNVQNGRRELVAQWRKELLDPTVDHDGRGFMDTGAYASLRPHLSPETLRFLEPPPRTVMVNPETNWAYTRKLLATDVAEIERRWKLI